MKRVQEILNTFGRYNSAEFVVKSQNFNFCMLFLKIQLLHLLGVHYIHSDYRRIKGRELLREILHKDYSDEEIYEKIKENNPEQLENVKNRIHYFKEFMYNLEKGSIVEVTNPKTKIKSHHFILHSLDEKYLQLGIARGDASDYLETFLVSSNDVFFRDTTINEAITGIYRYDEDNNLIPFSFDAEKAEKLEKEYREQNNDSDIADSLSLYDTAEDEWDNEI